MKRLVSPANLRIVLEIFLLSAILVLTLARSTPATEVSAQEPASPEAYYWYQCNAPMNVGLFTNRVHVYCATTTPIGGATAIPSIHWFAVPTSPDSAAASRYMSLFQSASIAGKTLWVYLDPNDTSGTSIGCSASDCRQISGAELR
jgi:hypothetical protein